MARRRGAAAAHGEDTPVVLFDWGETLMWVPGMLHDPDRHLACVERIFEPELLPHLRSAGSVLSRTRFIEHYHEACRRQIDWSKQTQREHRFDDRFAMALWLAGVRTVPERAVLRGFADALGREVVADARLLEHCAETVEVLARRYRLGVVSNYPHGPVVEAALERFGLRRHFAVIVVSSETGWMKPHADCYLPALDALPAPRHRMLMVGDDLRNDVKGAKALGLHTAWLAPRNHNPKDLDPDVDIVLKDLSELPAHCERLFA